MDLRRLARPRLKPSEKLVGKGFHTTRTEELGCHETPRIVAKCCGLLRSHLCTSDAGSRNLAMTSPVDPSSTGLAGWTGDPWSG